MIEERKPKLYLCGHVHESFGNAKVGQTLVINAACSDIVGRGWIADLDTFKLEKISV